MTPDRFPPPSRRFWRRPSFWMVAMLAIVLVSLIHAMTIAMQLRGPWYDEFYTLYVTRPGVPLPYAFHRWLADNHPPLFYALARATTWLGTTVEERRVVNLFLLVFAGIQLAWWLIPQGLRRIGWIYAVALASAWPAIDRAAELRSNYLAFIAAAVAVAALIGFDRGYRTHRKAEWAMLTLALLVAFNVHLAASMIVGGLVAAMILRCLMAREWASAARLFAAGTVAAAPLLIQLVTSFGQLDANTRNFWIQGGLTRARWAIQGEIESGLTANPPITTLAIVGFGWLAYRSWRERRLAPQADLALTLGAGLVIGCTMMVAIHLWRPFIMSRYLVALHPPVAIILALGAAALLDRIRPLFVLIFSLLMSFAALTAIHVNTGRSVAQPSWYGTGRMIATVQRNCPTTRVHVDVHGNRFVMVTPPTENRDVFPFAYRIVTDHFGFTIAPPRDRTMPRDCPTLFWTEHVAGQPDTARDLAMQLRAAGFPIDRARLQRIGYGRVLVTWPSR